MTELYSAGFQLVKVRALMLVSLACAAAACWWGWDLLLTLGLRPADGGVLQPFWIRLLVGGLVASLGLAFAIGMWIYSRFYVASLAHDPFTGCLIVRTPRFIGSRTESIAPSEIMGTSFRRGAFVNPGGVSVDAPWHALQFRGRRLYFIIDARGHWLDPALAEQVLQRSKGPVQARGRGRNRLERTGEAAAGAESAGR